eukprot:PLAT8866.1.p1 GENE.PLAT8866.1~~PLAT8866.1.p1  ORF type:complete len:205 (+),score=33.14 PLAT8866.1:2-616(+)
MAVRLRWETRAAERDSAARWLQAESASVAMRGRLLRDTEERAEKLARLGKTSATEGTLPPSAVVRAVLDLAAERRFDEVDDVLLALRPARTSRRSPPRFTPARSLGSPRAATPRRALFAEGESSLRLPRRKTPLAHTTSPSRPRSSRLQAVRTPLARSSTLSPRFSRYASPLLAAEADEASMVSPSSVASLESLAADEALYHAL